MRRKKKKTTKEKKWALFLVVFAELLGFLFNLALLIIDK